MSRCFRCKGEVPEPDLKEAVAREQDWRQWGKDHPMEALEDDERVLICIPCADELEELHDQTT